jgi:hypothetical protein
MEGDTMTINTITADFSQVEVRVLADAVAFKRPDTTPLKACIKKFAEAQRWLHETYALDHSLQEFGERMRGKGAPPVLGRNPSRNECADHLTAMHIVLAEARGKTHCDKKAWLAHEGLGYSRQKRLDIAKGLIVPVTVTTG